MFVHGLGGHPEETWAFNPPKQSMFHRHQRKKTHVVAPLFWPAELLSKEQSLLKARIVTWGYESSPLTGLFKPNNRQTVSQHGDDLLLALQELRINHVKPLPSIVKH